MELLFALILLSGGAAILLKGADWFTDGASDLARALGISALLVGIVLAGLEPEEMLTAAIASGRGAPDLALGNVIGTNITITTLALGLAAVLAPIQLAPTVRRQAVIATLVSVPPIVLLFFGSVSRIAGFLLLILFVGYTLVLIRTDRQLLANREILEKLAEGKAEELVDAPKTKRAFTPQERHAYLRRKGFKLLGGLIAMSAGGPAIVEGSLQLAHSIGLHQSVVGLTIVSLGTGAEMVALAIAAARYHKADILVGGIIGSFAYNLLVTLGLAAIIRPLPVNPHITQLALPILIGVHLLLLTLVWIGRIPRAIGILLLAAYAAYLVTIVVAR